MRNERWIIAFSMQSSVLGGAPMSRGVRGYQLDDEDFSGHPPPIWFSVAGTGPTADSTLHISSSLA
jgi:hypothetical protein